MSLTVKDLIKLKEVIHYELESGLYSIKEDIKILKQDVHALNELRKFMLETHHFISVEYPLLSGRLDDHELRIVKLEKA